MTNGYDYVICGLVSSSLNWLLDSRHRRRHEVLGCSRLDQVLLPTFWPTYESLHYNKFISTPFIKANIPAATTILSNEFFDKLRYN